MKVFCHLFTLIYIEIDFYLFKEIAKYMTSICKMDSSSIVQVLRYFDWAK